MKFDFLWMKRWAHEMLSHSNLLAVTLKQTAQSNLLASRFHFAPTDQLESTGRTSFLWGWLIEHRRTDFLFVSVVVWVRKRGHWWLSSCPPGDMTPVECHSDVWQHFQDHGPHGGTHTCQLYQVWCKVMRETECTALWRCSDSFVGVFKLENGGKPPSKKNKCKLFININRESG